MSASIFGLSLIALFLRLLRLLQAALEAIDTTATALGKLLAGIDRVAHAAGFHRLLFHRAWDHIDRIARGAGGFGIFMHLWVDSCFHEWGDCTGIVEDCKIERWIK